MILSTIQAVVADLSQPCAFTYADLYEANGTLGMTEISQGKDIFFVYIPPLESTDTVQDNGLIHTKFPFQFYMMRRLDLPTTEFKSIEIQPTIDLMLDLAQEFIAKLEAQDVVEKGTEFANGIASRKYNRELGWLDAHLFGVSCECEVPIMEGKTSCVH